MVACSAAFVAATLALTRVWGSFGFIFANCFNMFLRIAYCLKFVRDFYARRDDDDVLAQNPSTVHPLRGLLVPLPAWIAYFAAFLVTQISEKWIYASAVSSLAPAVAHLGVGGMAAGLTLGVVAFSEKEMIAFVRDNWSKRKMA